jgi:hypothetical protein
METSRFDTITSTVAQTGSRRGALRLLATAALGAGGLTLLGRTGTAAKKKSKGKGKGTGNGTGKGNGTHGGGSTGSGSSTPSAPGGGSGSSTPSIPQHQCPVAAKTNAPLCGNDPDGACDCHLAVEGNNFCGGFLTSCAGLRSCTSTQDCRESVGFHFVCQAAQGGGCGQVCVPACENRYP